MRRGKAKKKRKSQTKKKPSSLSNFSAPPKNTRLLSRLSGCWWVDDGLCVCGLWRKFVRARSADPGESVPVDGSSIVAGWRGDEGRAKRRSAENSLRHCSPSKECCSNSSNNNNNYELEGACSGEPWTCQESKLLNTTERSTQLRRGG